MRIKSLWVVLPLALLAGCGASSYDGQGANSVDMRHRDHTSFDQHLPDGRTVVCVSDTDDNSLSCDWADAH